MSNMRGSKQFCRRGSYFDNVVLCVCIFFVVLFFCFFFSLIGGGEDPNTTICGPFKWRFAGVPMLA